MTQHDDPILPLPSRAVRCPICGKPMVAAHRPFCSTRCAQIDLGRWLNGSYAVETDEPPGESPDEPS
jgi:endogenous inhibitor of DNA gyrase (YacG/DUF329 family)